MPPGKVNVRQAIENQASLPNSRVVGDPHEPLSHASPRPRRGRRRAPRCLRSGSPEAGRGAKKEAPKAEEAKKADDAKKDEPKADDAKKDDAKKDEGKKEETHAPDTHGMPGMSELFKSDAKK